MTSITFEGQLIEYNHNSKVARTTIHEPFYSAGKKLGWKNKSPGIGLNQTLIKFVLKTHCRLVVFVLSADRNYWITSEKLRDFMQRNNCDWKVAGNTWLKVFDWKLFTYKPEQHRQEVLLI